MPLAKVNGVNINYMLVGKGEPLILVMGLGAPLSGWKSQLPVFRQHFKVVLFDNRGIGKSDKPEGPYSARMMAEDAVELMKYLNIEKGHVLGVSMGGGIAQEIALNYPERVNKLILASTCALSDGGSSGGTLAFIEACQSPIRNLMYREVNLALNNELAKTIYVPLVWFQSRFMSKSDVIGLSGQLEAVKNYDTPHDRLSSVKCPTLVITGTKDRVVKPSSSDVLARLIPNSKLVKLENGSHMINTEMSKAFNSAVLDFLGNN
jgi:3-oxoadipate enol-lactonase